ncbi:hypothetical protein M9Y10_016632 [Tritrichomonas musculus]|uniref:ABC transporter family protein n=1 Tax=Tritrichomonas musculus TaxID=1915356 RepID=A0ABR2HXQ1_9EUKA
MSDSKTDSEPEINQILLEDFQNQQARNDTLSNSPKTMKKKKKKKHYYFPFLPRMYWLFYRHPLNFLIFIPSLTEGWCNMASTIVMGNIIDAINKDNALAIVQKNAIYALLSAVACAVLAFFNYTVWIIVGDLIGVKIKRILFKSFMEKDVEFFDTHPIGSLLVLLQQDCSMVGNAFTELKTHQVSCFGKLVVALIVMYFVDYRLATFSFLASIATVVIIRIFKQFAFRHFRKFLDFMSVGMTIADESISNERVVCSFNRQKEQIKLFDNMLDTSCRHDALARFYMIFSFSLSNVINDGCVCVVLNIGAFFILKGNITAGQLFTLSRAALWTGREINHLFDTLTHEQRAVDSSKRIFEILDLPVNVNDKEECMYADEDESVNHRIRNLEATFRGRVEFKNVWFKYPTRDSWVLKNVSFVTEPNQISAFVGHSGSGKSTIVQLLLRFYDVDQGEILLDGINIKEYPLSFLHRAIGVVQQDPCLFTMSVKENIAYAKPDATDDEIFEAAKIANAAKFIESLPQKYDTLCGEKGTLLSGGQIQRIAIARAVIENPTLLITDEATSALDAESESVVQAALDKVMQGRTSIIIAHRLGTIRAATQIFVFDQGCIVERGTHEELLATKGAYFNLVQRQLTK